MPNTKATLLIVDDEELIRTSLAQIFANLGHRVRSAVDGVTALIQIHEEVPDILLSDLDMPGISGFELLAVVRCRFPGIQVIAMSGAFPGYEMPYGAAADAFYQKGAGISSLLSIMKSLPQREQEHRISRDTPEPIRIQKNGDDVSGQAFVRVACPECLRTFNRQGIERAGMSCPRDILRLARLSSV